MPSKLVNRLKAWRKLNRLSQRQAAEVMETRGVPIDIGTLQQWEQGRRAPSRMFAKLLEDFLEKHPRITDAPAHGKRTKFSGEELAEIRRLREEGQTLGAIGARFGVDQSYISRIVRGERLVR